MSRLAILPLLSLAACLLAGPASALSYTPQIDFRNQSIWGGADNLATYSASQNGVDVTLSAEPSGAELRWYAGDGIGIGHSYENDEIENTERLQILFSGATQLSAIYLSDLFYEDGYYETGSYRIHDGSWQTWEPFDATLPGTGNNGEHVIVFDSAITVTGLRFKAPGKINGQDHEFSVLGLDAVPAPIASASPAPAVPEPSSFALFCVGGLAMASTRRVRRA